MLELVRHYRVVTTVVTLLDALLLDAAAETPFRMLMKTVMADCFVTEHARVPQGVYRTGSESPAVHVELL